MLLMQDYKRWVRCILVCLKFKIQVTKEKGNGYSYKILIRQAYKRGVLTNSY